MLLCWKYLLIQNKKSESARLEMKKAVTWLLRSAQCWGDSHNLLLTLNAAQMRGATVTPTTQEVAGWGTELARPGRPREEESSDGHRSEAAVKAFSSHGNQSCVQDYQKDLLAKGTSLMLERLEQPHNLKWNPAALLPARASQEWTHHV